ncbi:DHA2 family efflux MFS transporter permease subunit [Staphylococcus equorum]|uniref:DHA2 family efflux MFS transporter permease subunit n=1 Tax=Staphylococcus equorum TaxID=246432 RepID=UPI003D805FD7
MVQNISKKTTYIMISILMLGTFVAVLNQTLLTTALPSIMNQMSVSSSTAQWLTTIFMLVNGIMIPITAFLIQKFSSRHLFITAILFFTIGTMLCGFAPNFSLILVGRAIQAMGAGIMMPLMQTVLFLVFPKEKRGQAMGLFGLVIAFAPAIGPSLSGWLVSQYDWRVIFYILLVIAILDLILALGFLKNVIDTTNPSLDIISVVLSTVGFATLLYGFSSAGNIGWSHPSVYLSVLVGLVTLGFFIRRQLKLKEPLLDVRVFKYRAFTINMVLVVIVFISFIGSMTILPIYLQSMNHFSALESGLALMPGGIIMGILSPIAGKIFDKFGARILSFTGLLIVAVTSFAFTQLQADTSFIYISVTFGISMAANAMVMMPLTTAALNPLSQNLVPHGTAINNTIRQVAGAIGTAILVTIMTTTALDPSQHGVDGLVHGVRVTYGVLSITALIGSFMAILTPNQKN